MGKNIVNTKKALILSGGSVKGAFQAGAFKAVVESGFKPDFIYGISVGSLNGAFICNEAGIQNVSFTHIDWESISTHLIQFWRENITRPEDIAFKFNSASLFAHIWFEKFHGLLNTIPIQSLIKKTIDVQALKNSPVGFQVGAVNISNGEIVYADPFMDNFIDYLFASSAIPIIMPVVFVGKDLNNPCVDGGLRDVAPLKRAIDSGADEIICIVCYPEKFEGGNFNPRNLGQLAERIMDVAINEITNNDIEWAAFFNKYLPENGIAEDTGPLAGYRKIKLTIIRPTKSINIDIQNFSSDNINRLIEIGYQAGKEVLK